MVNGVGETNDPNGAGPEGRHHFGMPPAVRGARALPYGVLDTLSGSPDACQVGQVTEQERMGLRALAQELEDEKSTRASVSREMARTVRRDSTPADLAARLAVVLDPQSTRAASQLGPWDT